MKLVSFPTPYTEVNSKWMIDLTVRLKTIKLRRNLAENTGVDLCDLGLGNGFLDTTKKAQVINK